MKRKGGEIHLGGNKYIVVRILLEQLLYRKGRSQRVKRQKDSMSGLVSL